MKTKLNRKSNDPTNTKEILTGLDILILTYFPQ